VSPTNPQAQHVVTAVIVAHDGAAWIPRLTEALRAQTRPVQRVVGVDTGSRDRSGAMLAEALGRASVFGMDRGTGYGAAVGHALQHRAASAHLPAAPGAPGARVEWVWLLHDDCEPEPDALARLLAGADETPAAAVLGPKVLDWSDRDVLLEAGVGIDRAGRRVTGIEPREVDQGQHDGDRDVLAVGSAGLLVRRDVWEHLGGFDPGLLMYRDDLDFCWRVQAAGFRVRVITDAVIYHAEASARNRRQASAAPRRGRQDRRNGLLVLLTNLPAGPMLAALAGNLMLSALRTVFFLLAKRPGAALDEFMAVAGVVGHPLRLLAARRRRSAGRRAAYSRLRAEIPPGRSLRRMAEFATSALSRKTPVDTVGTHHATDDPTDDDSLLVDTGLVQRLLTNPGVLVFLVLTVIAVAAERRLLSVSPLSGGQLAPAWGGASALWSEYLQGFHPAGIGTAASTPPYVLVMALLATLLGGKPWLAVDVILLGCIPLAGVTAYLASRRITRVVAVRVWAAMAYALLPVGMGAVAAGRLGTALALVLLPVIGLVATRVFTLGRRRARRAAWAASVLVAVVAAFVPLVWLLTAAAMVIGAAVYRRGRPSVMIDAAIVAVVPVLLLLPWSLVLATHPAQLFMQAGLQPPGLAASHLAARSLLLLSPGGPGLPPYWVMTGLLLAAVVALLASGRALVLAGWAVALLGLVAAAVLSRVIVVSAASGDAVPAWPGPALALAAAGLLVAVAAAGDTLPGLLGRGRWRRPAGVALLALCAVACTAPVLAAASWLVTGVRGPVAPSAGPVLPEFVSVSSGTGLQLRTLVLRAGPHGRVTYMVLRDSDPLLGASDLPPPATAQRVLNLSVAALTAPYGGQVLDQGRALARLGIGYVLMPAPVSAPLARLLDGVPGLRPVSATSQFQLWRVTSTPARVTVTGPSGTVVAVPSGTLSVSGARAPAAGGTLVLAEPAGGWTATLNGHPLTPLAAPVDGWAQGFRLPPGGGTLSIGRSQLGRFSVVALELLAVAIVVALGLPGTRVAGEAEEGAAAARHGRGSGRVRARDGRAGGRDRAGSRGPLRRGKSGKGRPAVRRPPAPVAGDATAATQVVDARGTGTGMPAGTGVPAGAGMAAGAMAAGMPAAGMPAGQAVGRAAAGPEMDAPTMVTRGRRGAAPRHGGSYPAPGDTGDLPVRADTGDLPLRVGPGAGAAGPGYPPAAAARGGQAGYAPPPARAGYDTDADWPGYHTGAGQGRARDDTGPGWRGPGYDTGGGRPVYDTGGGRPVYDTGDSWPGFDTGGGRAVHDTGGGRAVPGPDQAPGRPGYDTGPGYRPPGSDSGAGGGWPGAGTGGGRAVYDTGPGPDFGREGYATDAGQQVPAGGAGAGRGRPAYVPDPRYGGYPGDEPAAGRGGAGSPDPPGTQRGRRASRLGWPGRDRRSAHARPGATRNEAAGAGAARSGPPAEGEALSPLPPLPPRRRRPMDSYPTDDTGAGWDTGWHESQDVDR
jgi:GT2 family glycosyltransferase